jgi:D-amino-acid dehydrogenase
LARIAVIGAGIVGASIATWLIGEGHEIVAYERDPDGLPASTGNASLIALPEIAPLASPDILKSVPGWLLDPLGPLALRWPDLPALTPWLIAFLASATPAKGARARAGLAALMHTALDDHFALGRIAGLDGHLRQTGYLSVHDSAASVKAALHEAELVRQALGYPYEQLSPEAARQLVPQLEGEFFGAIHQPVYWAASNPLTVLRHHQAFIRDRGRMVGSPVLAVEQEPDCVAVRQADGTLDRFDRVVIAAGVWSRDLVRQFGLKILLETERGYNTTFTDLDWNVAMPLGFADHGFVATPLVDGLRVGGAVELGRPETPANYARAKAMRSKMRRYVPSLPEGGVEWMGRRPSTPDSLPVISRHPQDDRIVFAFGHGHLGLTLSAVTARLVAGLIANRPVDVSAYDIRRFQ